MSTTIHKWIKEHKKEIIIFFIMLILPLLFLQFVEVKNVYADVGNNNSYSGGFDSGGDYESDGDGLFFIFYIILELIEVLVPIIGPVPTLIIILFIVGAVIFAIRAPMKTKNRDNRQYNNDSYQSSYTENAMQNPRNIQRKSEREIVSEIQQIDATFSAEDMKQKASECFVTLQNAWSEKDWIKVRPFETDALFNMHKSQLEEYIRNKTTNVIERINVSHSELVGYEVDGDYEVLGVKLDTRMRDYIIDDKSQKLIEGSKGQDLYVSYYMEFIRTVGVKTEKNKEITITNCPNCGAPTTVTNSGQCEYCQSVITNGNFSWVLNELTHY